MNYKRFNDNEILYLIKDNDENAENLMIEKYKPIVLSIASKYNKIATNFGADIDDLKQEGYIGLYKAINNYEEERGFLFYTYACICVEKQIQFFCRGLKALKNKPLNIAFSYDICVSNTENAYINMLSINEKTPLEETINKAFNKEIIIFKNNLKYLDSQIFELRINGFIYREIADLLSIPIYKVDKTLCKIRKELKEKKIKEILSE